MKVILFCQNAYAFGIMGPIRDALKKEGHPYIWFVTEKLLDGFPFGGDAYSSRILDLQHFSADVIFVPGNEVPHYLKGVKVQIFHGLAGEKKGHFRIRHYFDLYLTQGPYFTDRFRQLMNKHGNFEVHETGWPKLDILWKPALRQECAAEKSQLLEEHRASRVLLYAPTFSPSLTSAPFLLDEIQDLANDPEYLVLIKFHDLMEARVVQQYRDLAANHPRIRVVDEKNIVKYLILSDLLISDTSSVIYEFLLLDKPVISFRSIAENIRWENTMEYKDLRKLVASNLLDDPYQKERTQIKQSFHPYEDGKSAERMIRAAREYIELRGVPDRRELSWFRRLKIRYLFGPHLTNPYSGSMATPISALLITYNEIIHIRKKLENLNFADEIIVVDSFSTDGTAAVVKNHPKARLLQRPFKNFTDQKSFALDQAKHDWVTFTDADERIPDALLDEIYQKVNEPENPVSAYYFRRRFMFKDRVLRFSGWQSDKNYRLFRKSKCQFNDSKIVHETLKVDGPSGVLEHQLIHYSYRSYEDYRGKMLRYGQMKALEEFRKGTRFNWLAMLLRPTYKFLNHFILRLGILDGRKGLIISYLNALGVYSRYKELKRLGRNQQ
ncbi:CDP-glycerol glycerophosphotransferase family protein [Robiginitalea sp. IMCC43444]|uniref:CDP-glycerol glycerophosphotransferase family protein n=1 Tax=Robiginitalea sp. IMCC43444 TaxID=3459121 RepID=UPI0040417654